MIFGNDDRNPYEFIWVFDDDDQNSYESIWRCIFCYLTQNATHPYQKIGSGEGRLPYEKNRVLSDYRDFPGEFIRKRPRSGKTLCFYRVVGPPRTLFFDRDRTIPEKDNTARRRPRTFEHLSSAQSANKKQY